MKRSFQMLLLAAVYLAPHISSWLAIGMGCVLTIVGAVFAWRDRGDE